MAFEAPTAGKIRTAKNQAVGGGRKRCKKGKNCSAACIQAGMYCLVDMPEPAAIATTKVRDMLQSKVTAKGRENLRSKVILRGNYGGGKIVSNLDLDGKAPLSKTDLDLMERNWKRYSQTGQLAFPFKMPAKYDDKSGTPEAVAEIVSLRDKLKQDQKTGKIAIPDGTKISKKARALINEWNSLDMSTVYVNSVMGNRLNVSGLGVQAGPRNSVPKDAVRGLIQYVGLRRQQAELEDTPDGKRITSYRDPFTGQRRPYMIGNNVVASQDHWERPFGIYGIRSENDVRNTVYMPASMNSNKGEASPGRYLFQLLNKNGRLTDGFAADGNAVGGFRARYDKDQKKDFLPKGATRDSEKLALAEKAQWMIDKANTQVNSKVVPKIEKALQGEVTATQAAALIKDIAKHESKTNYFGGDLRFGNGARIMTPYEQNLVKGIKLEGSTGKLQTNIQAAIEASGKTPKQILQEVLQNRQGYTPTATGGAPGPAAPKAVKETKPANAPIKKAPAASAAPQSSGVEKIQKISDDQKLENLKAQRDEYTKRWVEATRKGNKEEAEKALAVRNFVSKEYDDFKKEYDDKYNRPVARSPKELMAQESKRVRDRIQSRIEEGTRGMPKETVDRWTSYREKEFKNFKKLSDDQLAALGLYGENKSKYYMDVNKFLRTGSMEGIPAERQQTVQNIVSNMNSALTKLPASSETNFERAVSGPGANGLRNLKVGDIIEDKGFGSYTTAGKPQTLDQFFRQGEDNAVMRVTSRNARDVSPVMEFRREAEHILRPGTKLRVTEVIEANNPNANRSRKVGLTPIYIFEEVE